MTRMTRILAVSLLALAAPLATGTAAVAHEGDGLCAMHQTGADFGQHVARHARIGHLGAEMHPGMHAGYSPCVAH